MFNASFPKTLVSLQLFRDTMDVSRIFLHQVGEEWIPYRMFTMQLHNNKVANPLYQMQRVWVAVPAVDRGSSDLFKMMNIFFNNPKLNSLIIDGQLEDVYVPHYASSWNNALDNKYYQVTQQGVNFDSNLFNDMTNKQINDNKLIMSTVIFPQTATPAVTYTGDALRSIAADFKMPVINKISTLCEIDFAGDSISPSKPTGLHAVGDSGRNVLRGSVKIGDKRAAHLVGAVYDTSSGNSRAKYLHNQGYGKVNMYAIGSLFPITSQETNNLVCRFELNITAYDFGGSSVAPEMPGMDALTVPASLELGVPALDLPFGDMPAPAASQKAEAVVETEKSYM